MSKQNKIILIFGAVYLSLFIIWIIFAISYAIKKVKLEENMIIYYTEDIDYEIYQGTIKEIDIFYDYREFIRVEITLCDHSNRDNVFCIYTKGFIIDNMPIKVGDYIIIYYDDKKFYNDWILPIYYIESSNEVILSTYTAKKELIDWVKYNVGL